MEVEVYCLGMGNIIRVVKFTVDKDMYIFKAIEDNGIEAKITLDLIPLNKVKDYYKSPPGDKLNLSKEESDEVFNWFKLKSKHYLFNTN
jgi:hypothetical protein